MKNYKLFICLKCPQKTTENLSTDNREYTVLLVKVFLFSICIINFYFYYQGEKKCIA